MKKQNKAQIIEQMKSKKLVKHQIDLAKKMFPHLTKDNSIYDAQTALNATAGYITLAFKDKISEITISDILPAIKKAIKAENKSAIKTSMEEMIVILEKEPAQNAVALLERFGNILGVYSMREFMKQPMSSIKSEEIIS